MKLQSYIHVVLIMVACECTHVFVCSISCLSIQKGLYIVSKYIILYMHFFMRHYNRPSSMRICICLVAKVHYNTICINRSHGVPNTNLGKHTNVTHTHTHTQNPGGPPGSGPEFNNCKVLHNTLQLSWRVDNTNSRVRFRLCGCSAR